MKKVRRIYGMLLLLAVLGMPALHAQSYDRLWKQVEQAQKKSLPQTVIKLTDEIYRKGEQEKNAPQMLKAYMCREAHQQALTPDSLYADVAKMERWVRREENPVNKSILHSLLAEKYAGMAQSNRNALSVRSVLEVDETPGDIREWSIAQFVEKVDAHSRAALQNPARLLEASSREYVPFVVQEKGSRFYGHDMYHLLATRAIQAYQMLANFQTDSLVNRRIKEIYEEMIRTYRQRAGAEDAVLFASLDYWNWKLSDGLGNESYPTLRMRKKKRTKSICKHWTA